MSAAVKADKSRQEEEEEEEQSIIKGLLPCILGIGGVAFAIWFGVYFFVISYGMSLAWYLKERFV